MDPDRVRAALGKLRNGGWRYLGEPYRRVFGQLELLGYVEGRLNPDTDLHEHRITQLGMDKLWELQQS